MLKLFKHIQTIVRYQDQLIQKRNFSFTSGGLPYEAKPDFVNISYGKHRGYYFMNVGTDVNNEKITGCFNTHPYALTYQPFLSFHALHPYDLWRSIDNFLFFERLGSGFYRETAFKKMEILKDVSKMKKYNGMLSYDQWNNMMVEVNTKHF
jgi:hypothetical protein